jgi:AhpD family alkylhydroperoxidase
MEMTEHGKPYCSDGGGGFWAFDRAATADGIPKKDKELIAVALTTQCTYCLAAHRGNAEKAGATPEEIAETAMVAAALRASVAVTDSTHVIGGKVAE